MSGKNLILVSSNEEDQIFATEIATNAAMTLHVYANAMEAKEQISEGDFKAALVDVSLPGAYESFENMIQEGIGLFSDRTNSNFFHFITEKDISEMTHLFQSPIFGHYIMRNYGNSSIAGKHYARIVRATMLERAFGLENLFGPQAKIQKLKLANTGLKQDAVEAVRSYLISVKFQSRAAAIVANAVDELLMNAIFDAPVDEQGKQIYTSTSRATRFDLKGKQEVTMQVGFDGTYIGVMVADCFGSLDKSAVFTYLSKKYTEDKYKVRIGNAGAGIGLASIFRSGGSFLFVCDSGSRTEVTIFFKLANNFREFRDQFRFISTQCY